MCLIKTHTFPKISRKPIKCYKLVEVVVMHKDTYSTLQTDHIFTIGDTIHSAESALVGIAYECLTSEVVHAFYQRFTTVMMAEYNQDHFTRKFIECEIPPYTLYYLGKFGEIGASRIKTIKEVEL